MQRSESLGIRALDIRAALQQHGRGSSMAKKGGCMQRRSEGGVRDIHVSTTVYQLQSSGVVPILASSVKCRSPSLGVRQINISAIFQQPRDQAGSSGQRGSDQKISFGTTVVLPATTTIASVSPT
mmetsp:Transcript_21094/g.49356  ORF Transcript_21094/g.49356 Transcript_21094/m.49356 type:complete len:125 (-) Transcript_21094:38-412(-)